MAESLVHLHEQSTDISYSIVYTADDITPFFSDVKVSDGYLTAIFKNKVSIRERLVKLDKERFLFYNIINAQPN